MKALMALCFLISLSNVFAAEIKLVKVKELGLMRHKVIYQSTQYSKIKNTNAVTAKLVARWGVHVFEVVNGLYSCNARNVCSLSDYERIATYESCIVKADKVKCSKKIGGGSSDSTSNDSSISENPDSTDDGSLTYGGSAGGPDGFDDEYDNGRAEIMPWP